MAKEKATIAQVARDAGVSIATVSRALNNPDAVAKGTLRKVQDSVSRLDFRLNAAARALRSRETRRILVALPSSSNIVNSEVLTSLNSVLNKKGYVTLIMDTSDKAEMLEAVRLIQNREVDAVVSMHALLHEQVSRVIGDLPLTYVSEWPPAKDFSFVKSDNFAGGEIAASHLIGLGHSYLGQLAGSQDGPMALERREGFISRAKQAGLLIDPDWHIYSNWQMNDGLALAQRVVATLSRGEVAPTGWFFASDEMAIAFMGELLRSGISVPGQISVVGFDDIPQAKFLHPSLTTVRQDPRSLGSSAANALLASLKGLASGEPFQASVPVELVARDSTTSARS